MIQSPALHMRFGYLLGRGSSETKEALDPNSTLTLTVEIKWGFRL
jgi:hypothetical protein